MKKKLRFVDLFCGCGGFSKGFIDHGGYEGVLAVDWKKSLEKTFTENHPGMEFMLADLFDEQQVNAVVGKIKNNCDVIIGGPPCQGFSTMGKRNDTDKRNTLIEQFIRICKKAKPKVIIMENVRGITSKIHSSGKTFPEVIQERLSNGAGYDVEPILIKASEYGVPQTRQRWLLFGVERELNREKKVLQKIKAELEKRKTTEVKTLREAIGDLPRISAGEGADVQMAKICGKTVKLFNHKAMNHGAKLVRRFSFVPAGGGLLNVPRKYLTPHLIRMIEGKYGNGGHVKNIYGRMEWNKPSGTIIAGMDKITCGRFLHPEDNRLLTPRECARIQSFPDDFRFYGSQVEQYYMIGNAVPPSVAKIIAGAVF